MIVTTLEVVLCNTQNAPVSEVFNTHKMRFRNADRRVVERSPQGHCAIRFKTAHTSGQNVAQSDCAFNTIGFKSVEASRFRFVYICLFQRAKLALSFGSDPKVRHAHLGIRPAPLKSLHAPPNPAAQKESRRLR